MNFDDPDQLMLQGTLILADPSMKDPNFARAVIFLTAHSPAEGAHGFILNRPLGSCVADFLQSEEFSPLAEVPVFLGGPVETGELTFGASWWDKSREEVRFVSHLSKEGAIEAVEQGHSVKAFVGYAGWAGGQLEAELRQTRMDHQQDGRVILSRSLRRKNSGAACSVQWGRGISFLLTFPMTSR